MTGVLTKMGNVNTEPDTTKVHIVKAMVFPVVTYRYESWTIRKAQS